MIEKNQENSLFTPINQENNNVCCSSLEIDLHQLFKELWARRLSLLVMMLVFTFISTFYALAQPNIYKSNATFYLNNRLYSLDSSNSLMISKSFLSSSSFIAAIQKKSPKSELDLLSGITISYNPRTEFFTISKVSDSLDDSYKGVALTLEYLEPTLKLLEIENIESAIESVSSLEHMNFSEDVKNSLNTIYALQLYKKAVLENPESQIAYVVEHPVKPTSHIKPKRTLMIIIGAALGLMLGIFIVLIRLSFKKGRVI